MPTLRGTLPLADHFAGSGSSATSRKETERASSWKCGLQVGYRTVAAGPGWIIDHFDLSIAEWCSDLRFLSASGSLVT